MKKIPHFINNRPVDSQDGRTFDSVNPATQEVWAQAAHGGKAESDAAVSAARKAFDEGPWPRMTVGERAKILHKLADLVEDNLNELAEIEITLDNNDKTAPDIFNDYETPENRISPPCTLI